MDIATYLDRVRALHASGQATEHSYRPALQALFASIHSGLTIINEPKKTDAGMVEFIQIGDCLDDFGGRRSLRRLPRTSKEQTIGNPKHG